MKLSRAFLDRALILPKRLIQRLLFFKLLNVPLTAVLQNSGVKVTEIREKS